MLDLTEPVKGIIITERSEIEAVCVGRYFPKRLKRLHLFDNLSMDIFRFKKAWDPSLIERLSAALADVIRATGRTFDIATHPPASRPRLYYPCAHLAKATAVELDLDLLDCLKWSGKTGSQKKRRGVLKLARLGESVLCPSDLTDLRVLLIDDILTTGLTASKCVEGLTFAGAGSVFVTVLGWTQSEDDSGFAKINFKRRF